MGRGVLDPMRGSFNKWQMHRVLSGEDIGPCQLPETRLWHPQTLLPFLDKHAEVYIKPLHTWGGQNVGVVKRRGSELQFTSSGQSRSYASGSDLILALLTVYPPHGAIVQQAAPLCRYNGRVFDIRVLMQRNEEDKWVTAGMLARVGGEGAVVSNVRASRGTVQEVNHTLRRALPRAAATVKQRQRIKAALRSASERICNLLSPYRWFSEVGLDFGIDQSGKLWLIEVNTDDAVGGPSHALFAELPDPRLFLEIEERAYRNQLRRLSGR